MSSEIEKQINEQMKKAFFDIINQNILSDKPDYEWLVSLYSELKERLLRILKKDSKTYKQIDSAFDIELFNSKKNVIVFMEDNTTIMEKIILLSNAKNKQYESLSSKTRFKFLDLNDAIIKYNSRETSITNLKTTTHILKQK